MDTCTPTTNSPSPAEAGAPTAPNSKLNWSQPAVSPMSVASVARTHGINHNILHRWLRELPDPGALRLPDITRKATPAFIELPITESNAPAVVAADSVHVEIERGDLSVKLHWPAASASACTHWLLELLR